MSEQAICVGFIGAGANTKLHHIPKLRAQPAISLPDVDAICIGTWPYMHAEMSIAALAAGKHVLCEARMAMNAAEGRRMLEASRKAPKLIVTKSAATGQTVDVKPL